MITARDYFTAYLDALVAGGEAACKDYQGPREVWTRRATLALSQAGQLVQVGAETAAKGDPDRHGRSEYLALDVTVYDAGSWAPPLFVGEHENWVYEWRVQYAAWKLLSVEAKRRMLVAYYGERTEIPSFDRLTELVREVCRDNKGKDIFLVGGEYYAEPANVDDLRAAHNTEIVGVHS